MLSRSHKQRPGPSPCLSLQPRRRAVLCRVSDGGRGSGPSAEVAGFSPVSTRGSEPAPRRDWGHGPARGRLRGGGTQAGSHGGRALGLHSVGTCTPAQRRTRGAPPSRGGELGGSSEQGRHGWRGHSGMREGVGAGVYAGERPGRALPFVPGAVGASSVDLETVSTPHVLWDPILCGVSPSWRTGATTGAHPGPLAICGGKEGRNADWTDHGTREAARARWEAGWRTAEGPGPPPPWSSVQHGGPVMGPQFRSTRCLDLLCFSFCNLEFSRICLFVLKSCQRNTPG